jgi:hypothetical protein
MRKERKHFTPEEEGSHLEAASFGQSARLGAV